MPASGSDIALAGDNVGRRFLKWGGVSCSPTGSHNKMFIKADTLPANGRDYIADTIFVLPGDARFYGRQLWRVQYNGKLRRMTRMDGSLLASEYARFGSAVNAWIQSEKMERENND